MASREMSIGRARTALVYGSGKASQAVISTVIGRIRRSLGKGRLTFTGPAVFDDRATLHLGQTVLPLVDRIVAGLHATRGRRTKARPKSFEVSVINLAAASTADVGLCISGFSADVPVLLALLSAALKIPLAQDVVTTGHVASSDGDIRPVKNIPAKLAAAVEAEGIERFIQPSLDTDASMRALSPAERDRIEVATIRAKDSVRAAHVADVTQLLREALSDEAIVLGSLQSGFFEPARLPDSQGTPIEGVVGFLAEGNGRRFWRCMEDHLLAGNGAAAQALLLARARHQLRRKRYPANLGRKLLQLIQSLPPATRRIKQLFPLLPREQCLRVCQFAEEKDYEDVQCLMDATLGKAAARPRHAETNVKPLSSGSQDAAAAVDAVLSEISAEALSDKIGIPIDSARAAYVMKEVVTDCSEEFYDIVSAFYLAMLRHTGTEPASADHRTVADESLALLERAFADKGGASAALAEGRDGIHGGMRFVLDVMTEQYKFEKQSDHVRRVLQDALDPLDWEQRMAFMRAFLDRMGPQLPPEIRSQPPERFARHYETILQTYVQSLDRVKQLLRRL